MHNPNGKYARSKDASLSYFIQMIDSFKTTKLPSGYTFEVLQREGIYQEQDLLLTRDDLQWVQLYAGLAVLVWDMEKDYFPKHPKQHSKLFDEVVSEVSAYEKRWYGNKAFPYDHKQFPEKEQLKNFPKGIVEKTLQSPNSIEDLAEPEIVHEWTTKVGKRLLMKFAVKFKDVICAKGGPYDQLKNGLLDKEDLKKVLGFVLVQSGFSPDQAWVPLAAFLSLLLIKTGLDKLCQGAEPAKT